MYIGSSLVQVYAEPMSDARSSVSAALVLSLHHTDLIHPHCTKIMSSSSQALLRNACGVSITPTSVL